MLDEGIAKAASTLQREDEHMTDSSSSRTTRLLAELVIVFLGVFIALAVDAWWAGRVERQRELEYLQALHEDMTAGSTNVQTAIDKRPATST